jgi:CDP-paratose 2-epimerase
LELPVSDIDWVIDAAALPSVMAGIDGKTSSRQAIESNLLATVNVLEYCKRYRCGLILLSTSRVYSISTLGKIPLQVDGERFTLCPNPGMIGLSEQGIDESFPTTPPLSLYGSTKLCSEQLAIEYAATFEFPLWINRCGLLAGGGQFARPDQGIVAYWIHAHLARRNLRFFGYGGHGHQVRDLLHPHDLGGLIVEQLQRQNRCPHVSPEACPTDKIGTYPTIVHVSGGAEQSFSLLELHQWCNKRFGVLPVAGSTDVRVFDAPWIVLDNRCAKKYWNWTPKVSKSAIFEELAVHAQAHPHWLELTC